jgi:uncharacterized membrane protein YccF (DUF307 family)
MRVVLNLLWLILAGVWLALGYLVAAVIMAITIIGLPFAKQALKLAQYALWPVGRTLIKADTRNVGLSVVGNVLWFVLVGWWLALEHLVVGCLLCLTVIGIPLGIGTFKMASAALVPFGRRIVDKRDLTYTPTPSRLSSAGRSGSSQRVDRGGGNDSFHLTRQLCVQRDERVRLQLREGDVLRVVGRRPPQLIRQLPCVAPEHGVAEKPDRQRLDAGEAVDGDVRCELARVYGFVESRERLRAQEGRCKELVLTRNLDALAREVQDDTAVDDESGHVQPCVT